MLNKIDSFAFVLGPIFYKLVYMSIIASCIGIAILIIRKLFYKKISPKWVSRLWILVFIALICPIQISSVFSIYNYIPENTFVLFNYSMEEIPSISFREEYETAIQETQDISNKDISKSETQQIQKNNEITYIKSLIIDIILPYLWLIVGEILIITYITRYVAFAIKLSKYENSRNEKLLFILERCKTRLNINKKIKIIEQDKIKTPSLFGIFNICIIVPNNINRLTDLEIKCVLMHELSHYKRRDNVLKSCLTLVKYVYFFNPIIYIIYKQIIKDMEVATDEMAVYGFEQENKKEYCKTLIKLTNEYEERSFVAKTLAISNNKNNLERRIRMVKLSNGFIKHRILITIISIIIMLMLGVTFLTKPKINNETIKENETATNQNKQDLLTEAEALNIGKEKFEKIKKSYWSWRDNNIEGEGSNLKIKEVYIKEIKDMCTENAFKQFIEYWGIDVANDGYYYFGEGVGTNPRYISDELTIESINEKEIIYTDTVKYDDVPAIKKNKFILVKKGENWLIENFTMPY